MPKVLLKDVVARIKDKVDKDNTDLKYYIGGEHFDSGEIQITKKGIIKESTIGPAFHMRFQPGDVLLMSRNPHLRKAGIVDFEGICSDVSYVCRTKDENVLMQRFIPFIFQTDHFWKFAEENKKGSTNFFLNWSDFEKYEFELPQIDEQKKLCEMMWAFEDTKSAYKDLLLQTDELVKSQFIEMFGDPLSENSYYKKISILDACDNITGGGTPSKKHPEYYEGNIPWVSPKDMNTSIIEDSQDHITEEAITKSTTKLIPEQSVLMVIRSGVLKHDLPIAINKVPVTINQDMKAFFVGSKIIPQYLFGYFKTIEADVLRGVRAVTADNIEFKVFQERLIQIPPMGEQKKFAEFMIQTDKSKFELKQAIEDINNLMRVFMAQNTDKED